MAKIYKPKSKSTNLGKQLSLTIESLDINGDGVARHNNKPIFIAGALPGEQVKVKVTEEKSKYQRGKLLQIETASPKRISAKCEHFDKCGGCQLQHINDKEQKQFKQDKVDLLFKRNAEVQELPWQSILAGAEWHYRRKSRIGIQYNKNDEPIVGFRQGQSNSLVAVKNCPVLPASAFDLFNNIRSMLVGVKGKKSITHVEYFKLNESNILIFRAVKSLSATDLNTIKEASIEHKWYSAIQYNNKFHTITDNFPEMLTYNVDSDVVINFGISDFIQVNDEVNQLMIQQAIEWLTLENDDSVLDLFCGLGNFSLPIAKRSKQVIGVEGVQEMVTAASKNAELNGIKNCQFFQTDLNGDWAKQPFTQMQFNKVLLDPARAGAHEAITQLVKYDVHTLLYVSCDPATLARDTKLLLNNGFKIKKIGLIDMFSQTKHIESMVLFCR